MTKSNSRVKLYHFDIIKDDPELINGIEKVNLVIHAASIASPNFLPAYPLETIDANITGLRRLLDYYSRQGFTGMLFFPAVKYMEIRFLSLFQLSEDYRGNVSTMGPRACYDEAKRSGKPCVMCLVRNMVSRFQLPGRLIIMARE
jgi:UDP-glucuronate decarboxylase